MKPFPKPVPFTQLLGPSFIILALGLGSGEVILWPFLASNYGLGILWAAILGISCQYFINMEIARYALVKGESIFVGLNKAFPWSPYWFIASTFIGFGLPGIIAASAKVLASVFGIHQFSWIAIGMLLFIGFILSASKTVYGMMERLTKIIIILGVSFIFILTLFIAKSNDWLALLQGLIGKGDQFWFFPADISLAAFLAAFAYSGAGGNLNLTQSIYIKEKGYGMGKYAQKIAGLFTGAKANQTIKLSGESFDQTPENIANFRAWWRLISVEHLLVFWLIGSIAMALLMLLSFATAFGVEGNASGIQFVINQGLIISQTAFGFIGALFLVVISIMLFQTQLGVLDSTSRIMAENVAIKKLGSNNTATINLSFIYFTFLWLQILFGVLLFLIGLHEPRQLIILGAVINAIAMTVHIALVNIANWRLLPKPFQAALWRKIIIAVIFMIFAVFSVITIVDTIF